MKQVWLLAASLAITCAAWATNASSGPHACAEEPATKEAEPAAKVTRVTGRLETLEGQSVLTLWGTPKERGFAHGTLLAKRIMDGVRHDFEHALKPLGEKYDSLVTKIIVPKFHFESHERAELEGLYEGLKRALPEGGLRVDALGRDLGLIDLKAMNTFGDWYGLGCSSVAVWGKRTVDGLPLVGRNFDFPTFDLILKHQLVVVHAPMDKRAGFVAVTYPGSIGVLTSMNTHGVFASVHDVKKRPDLAGIARPNVPRLTAMRRFMETLTSNDVCPNALKMAKSWPTLYGNNIMIAAPKGYGDKPGACVLEYDSKTKQSEGVTMRRTESAEGSLCLACTNHHRERSKPAAQAGWSFWRYGLLTKSDSLAKDEGRFSVERMFKHMTEASFPRNGGPLRPVDSLEGVKRREGFGTLHQSVGRCGPAQIHVRLGVLGKNIADCKIVGYDVKRWVGKAQPAPVTTK